MIELNNITRKYGDFKAVDDVSFTILPGEIVGLLGHNGAGKTTIMKMITGCLEPTKGTITIDGMDIATNRCLIQKMIGYLPENCPVYPEMTVIDYLDYAAALHGLPEKERYPHIAAAINQTALKEKATQPISTLSRGYRQRTGVAQAILHKPRIVILDEPTNGLDPTQIQHMRNLITDLAKHSTVIISTHILQEVQAVCDRVIIMKDGKKALDSRLDDLRDHNRLLLTLDPSQQDPMAFFNTLQGITSAVQVTPSPPGVPGQTYALTLSEDQDHHRNAASVARSVHSKGWPLYAMHFETRNLETIFAEISVQ